MTEQIEDDFWAQERARAAAERGRQADPGACGTCRDRVKAGGQVVHDECAQRATLLPAPDAPGYELITGMSEDEVHALPARFHIPAYVESSTPQMWVCAVCWGDGWSTQWPCKTATEQGLRVFTPEHQAETAAKRQTARIAELEAQLTEMTHLRDNALRALNRDDVDTDPHLPDLFADGLHGLYEWDTQPEPDQAPKELVERCVQMVQPAFGKLTQQRDQARTIAVTLEQENAQLEADRNSFRDQRNIVFKTNGRLHTQVEESDQARLRAQNDTRTARREADAFKARVAELEAELRIGSPWKCPACGKGNRRDVCVICEQDRPDTEPGEDQ